MITYSYVRPLQRMSHLNELTIVNAETSWSPGQQLSPFNRRLLRGSTRAMIPRPAMSKSSQELGDGSRLVSQTLW